MGTAGNWEVEVFIDAPQVLAAPPPEDIINAGTARVLPRPSTVERKHVTQRDPYLS